jgi:hypothetical protein
MSTWLDKLSDHGATRVEKKRKRLGPRHIVHEVIVTVRHPNRDGDPGSVDVGHYIVADGVVTLTTADGELLKDGGSHELGDCEPRFIAQMLLRQRRSEKGSDFNRDLRPYYRDRGVV